MQNKLYWGRNLQKTHKNNVVRARKIRRVLVSSGNSNDTNCAMEEETVFLWFLLGCDDNN